LRERVAHYCGIEDPWRLETPVQVLLISHRDVQRLLRKSSKSILILSKVIKAEVESP
jgi:hypothetical protein